MPQKISKVRKHTRRRPHREERTNVKEYERAIDLVAPEGNEKKFLRARRAMGQRTPRAHAQDLRLECEETGMIDEPGFLDKWLDHPAELDLFGVDDTVYGPSLTNFSLIKQLLERRRGVIKSKVHETVKSAKARIDRIKKAPIPRSIKKERIAKVKQAVKTKIKEEIERERKVVAKVVAKVRERHIRSQMKAKKWPRERTKRARVVMKTIGCNIIEADALIRRAALKDLSYDVVNWDNLQGDDLEYGERLRKLEAVIGETRTEEEYYRDIAAEKDAFDLMHKEVVNEADSELETAGALYTPIRRAVAHPESYADPGMI